MFVTSLPATTAVNEASGFMSSTSVSIELGSNSVGLVNSSSLDTIFDLNINKSNSINLNIN